MLLRETILPLLNIVYGCFYRFFDRILTCTCMQIFKGFIKYCTVCRFLHVLWYSLVCCVQVSTGFLINSWPTVILCVCDIYRFHDKILTVVLCICYMQVYDKRMTVKLSEGTFYDKIITITLGAGFIIKSWLLYCV